MTRKMKSITILFSILVLIISNAGSEIYSFAQSNNVNENTINLENSDNVNCRPDKVTQLRTELKNSTSMKLVWKRVRGVDGYIVYRSTVRNGIYKKIAKTCKKTSSYVDNDLEPGTTYYYKVRAYTILDNKVFCGCYSDILEATTCPSTVKCLHTSCVSDSSIRIEWSRVCKASGYEVYRTTSSTGVYTKVATITDGSKPFYVDKNLKSNKKYYYKVRAFKEVNGQICFGDCSKEIVTCTKK